MAIGYGVACPKPRPRALENKDRRMAKKNRLRRSINQAWADAGGLCCHCRRRCLRTSTDPLRRGEVHHVLYRSRGGSDDVWNLQLVCGECHAKIHAGELESERSLGQRVRTA